MVMFPKIAHRINTLNTIYRKGDKGLNICCSSLGVLATLLFHSGVMYLWKLPDSPQTPKSQSFDNKISENTICMNL